MLAIKIYNIEKKYGEVEALKGISFEVNEGEMFGLVGPDGAGKTSTIRILCGLLLPSAGKAEIFGHDLVKDKINIQKQI
jgi:ABC-2 type transport system ATP-binding protein